MGFRLLMKRNSAATRAAEVLASHSGWFIEAKLGDATGKLTASEQELLVPLPESLRSIIQGHKDTVAIPQ